VEKKWKARGELLSEGQQVQNGNKTPGVDSKEKAIQEKERRPSDAIAKGLQSKSKERQLPKLPRGTPPSYAKKKDNRGGQKAPHTQTGKKMEVGMTGGEKETGGKKKSNHLARLGKWESQNRLGAGNLRGEIPREVERFSWANFNVDERGLPKKGGGIKKGGKVRTLKRNGEEREQEVGLETVSTPEICSEVGGGGKKVSRKKKGRGGGKINSSTWPMSIARFLKKGLPRSGV